MADCAAGLKDQDAKQLKVDGVLWRCLKISFSPTDIYLINNKYGSENIFTIYCIREAVKNVLADFVR